MIDYINFGCLDEGYSPQKKSKLIDSPSFSVVVTFHRTASPVTADYNLTNRRHSTRQLLVLLLLLL